MSKIPPCNFWTSDADRGFFGWSLWNGAQRERAGDAALRLLSPTKMPCLLLDTA